MKVTSWSWKFTALNSTYIRTIIDDLGEKPGCGAHVIFLRRSRSATIRSNVWVTLSICASLVEQAEQQGIPVAELLDPLLMPMDSPASDYPIVNIPLTSSVYFKNGNPVMDFWRTAGRAGARDGRRRRQIPRNG